MSRIFRTLGQVAVYILIAAILGTFATWPGWQRFPEDQARITLNFSHGGERVSECRRLTAAEIAELPANMRKPTDCPRGRVPVHIEIEVDGELLLAESLAPSGLAGDGQSTAYHRFAVAPGPHRIVTRLRDTGRETGFDYTAERDVVLAPRQNFVVDFQSTLGGFQFR